MRSYKVIDTDGKADTLQFLLCVAWFPGASAGGQPLDAVTYPKLEFALYAVWYENAVANGVQVVAPSSGVGVVMGIFAHRFRYDQVMAINGHVITCMEDLPEAWQRAFGSVSHATELGRCYHSQSTPNEAQVGTQK